MVRVTKWAHRRFNGRKQILTLILFTEIQIPIEMEDKLGDLSISDGFKYNQMNEGKEYF